MLAQPTSETRPSVIRESASFAELERRRTSFSWTLTIIMLGIYFLFIYLVAYQKPLLGTPISGVITLGFPLGIFVILSAIALTGLYVFRANTQFDRLTEQVVGDVGNANRRGGVR
jgi:uncharacterized membrane protein (DUF485 family)